MTQGLPPEDPLHPREEIDLSPEEEQLARKIDIVKDLRALVETPGWAYLCNVLRHKALNVRQNLKEGATLDAIILNNSELREAATYEYLIDEPAAIIAEFTLAIEASNDDSE